MLYFNIRAFYHEEIRALVRYFYSKGHRKIGLFTQADAYGKNGELGADDALAAFGLTAVKVVTYRRNEPFETDMSSHVKLLRDSEADAVIVGVYGPSAAFIRDSRMSGWNVPIANLSFVGATTTEAARFLSTGVGNSFQLLKVPSNDEIGVLTATFNRMAAQVVKQHELRGSASNREDRSSICHECRIGCRDCRAKASARGSAGERRTRQAPS